DRAADVAQTESRAQPAAAQPDMTLETVRRELAAALTQMGLPTQESRAEVASQLERIAQESAELAGKLLEPEAKLEARNLELQAYNALARQAQQQPDTDANV